MLSLHSGNIQRSPDLAPADVDYLHLLMGDWQIISDLVIADIALWILDEDGLYKACAHVRPATAHTRFPHDFVGETASEDMTVRIEQSRATGECIQHESYSVVPLGRQGRRFAYLTVHQPMTYRGTGEQEQAFISDAWTLLEMCRQGLWPEQASPTGPRRGAPRVGDGFLHLDVDGIVVYCSPNAVSAFRRLGVEAPLVGQKLSTAVSETLTNRGLADESLPLVLQGKMPWRSEIRAHRTILTLRSLPLRTHAKRFGAILLCRDVSELRRREEELLSKDATIREIHHRVKNNLQTVAALLRLQSRRMSSAEAKEGLTQAMQRVETIAQVHEALSHGMTQTVDFDELVGRQIRMIAEIYSSGQSIETHLEGRFGHLPSAVATPLALVINELVANSVEHGFEGRESGNIWLKGTRFESESGEAMLKLTVSDDGQGLPNGETGAKTGAARVPRSSGSLGLQIVRTLVDSELRGSIVWNPRAGGGTEVQVVMSAEAAQE